MGASLRKVWWIADSVVTSLGVTTSENYLNISSGKSGLKFYQNHSSSEKPVCLSQINEIEHQPHTTRFETLTKKALDGLFNKLHHLEGRTLFILSTTKGNIELLEQGLDAHSRIHLHQAANFITQDYKFSGQTIISNACTSGVTSLILAKRQIECGNYDHAVVLGADVLSKFIISGFQSLNALSDSPCNPFDANRTGINLGEGAACVLLSSAIDQFNVSNKVAITGGGLTNDANHISGPSKTGEELAAAINQAMQQSNLKPIDIDFISAHGTATIYNDEMESKAFHLSGLSDTPLHSLKGYFGHTLGAAGVIESIMSVRSLAHQETIACKGFTSLGVSKPINVIQSKEAKSMKHCIKTSSGFGGCNAAITLSIES